MKTKNTLIKHFLLFSLSFGPVHVLANNADFEHKPSIQAPLASQSLTTDIVQLSSGHLVAVGERGHILLSSDGEQWQQAASPTQALLTSVYFIDDKHGWAVGHDATILSTSDSGKSWAIQYQDIETEFPLLDIFFKDANHGVAVGAYGNFLRTADGGKTWNKEFHAEFLTPDDADYLNELKETDPEEYKIETASILPHFNRLTYDEKAQRLYLVGELGLAAYSNDFGQIWQRYDDFYQGSFFDVLKTDGHIVAVGLRGNVFSSSDGKDWKPISTSQKVTINSALASGTNVYLFANSGVIFHSKDSGQTFSTHVETDGKAIVNGVVVQNGLVLATESGLKTITLPR